eukprot:gb/GECG01008623.1/.p1 GENE.gb/GECG01008623.1/~~gb/GECG01008623.1/.p1  ORF type:complete len:1070 (+),score=171.89 gb/GECG01008623.1/:1-3210(+)
MAHMIRRGMVRPPESVVAWTRYCSFRTTLPQYSRIFGAQCRFLHCSATLGQQRQQQQQVGPEEEHSLVAGDEEEESAALRRVEGVEDEETWRRRPSYRHYQEGEEQQPKTETTTSSVGRTVASVSTQHGGQRQLVLETGRFGPLADSAVFAKYGDSSIFTTVVSDREFLNQNFMPFQVDYREKTFAAGFIPHTFGRRETLPSDKEVLVARFIDRALRPLFPPGYCYDTQLVSTVMSYDNECPTDPLSIIGASTALMLSDIPFHGPVAAVRVGMVDGKFVVNPTEAESSKSDLNLLFAGTYGRTVMVEVEANEIPEEQLMRAMKMAEEEIQPLLVLQEELRAKAGKEKRWRKLGVPPRQLVDVARSVMLEDAKAMCRDTSMTKHERAKAQAILMQQSLHKIKQSLASSSDAGKDEAETLQIQCQQAAEEVLHEAIRGALLENGKKVLDTDYKKEFKENKNSSSNLLLLDSGSRIDGRASMDLRRLQGEVDIFPKVHGSSLFSRGDTQCMCTVTLGPPTIAQQLRPVAGGTREKRFMLHYEFPPYCVNEVGRSFAINRRMIGHGALAEKALAPMIPSEEEFPYVVRTTSEVSGSDGSSSMATVCGGSLALLDAGVPMKNTVAGVSVGLVTPFGFHKPSEHASCSDEPYLREIYDSIGYTTADSTVSSSSYMLMTDILGLEDHFGDMDFKVAGTDKGITAIQLDIKLPGVSLDVLKDAMKVAKIGRLRVLRTMNETISAPRPKLKHTAPRMELLAIPRELRSRVIGPGGMFLRAIENETGAALRFLNEPGREDLQVFAENNDALEKAIDMVKGILLSTNDGNLPEGMNFSLPGSESPLGLRVGDKATGEVTDHLDFGAIISVNDVDDAGLLHVSQILPGHVQKLSDIVPIGTKITAKVTDVDPSGRAKFSIRALIEEGAKVDDVIIPRAGIGNASTEGNKSEESGPSKTAKIGSSEEQSLADSTTGKLGAVPETSHTTESNELKLHQFLPKSKAVNGADDPLDLQAGIKWEKVWFEYLGNDISLSLEKPYNANVFSAEVALHRVAPKPGNPSKRNGMRTKSKKTDGRKKTSQ